MIPQLSHSTISSPSSLLGNNPGRNITLIHSNFNVFVVKNQIMENFAIFTKQTLSFWYSAFILNLFINYTVTLNILQSITK